MAHNTELDINIVKGFLRRSMEAVERRKFIQKYLRNESNSKHIQINDVLICSKCNKCVRNQEICAESILPAVTSPAVHGIDLCARPDCD